MVPEINYLAQFFQVVRAGGHPLGDRTGRPAANWGNSPVAAAASVPTQVTVAARRDQSEVRPVRISIASAVIPKNLKDASATPYDRSPPTGDSTAEVPQAAVQGRWLSLSA